MELPQILARPIEHLPCSSLGVSVSSGQIKRFDQAAYHPNQNKEIGIHRLRRCQHWLLQKTMNLLPSKENNFQRRLGRCSRGSTGWVHERYVEASHKASSPIHRQVTQHHAKSYTEEWQATELERDMVLFHKNNGKNLKEETMNPSMSKYGKVTDALHLLNDAVRKRNPNSCAYIDRFS